MPYSGIVLNFACAQLGTTAMHVVALDGEEQISRPYRFELQLVSSDANVDCAALVGKPAQVQIKRPENGEANAANVSTHYINGVLSEFDFAGLTGTNARYRAVIVPRLQFLAANFRSRVFLDKSVREIALALFAEIGLASDDYEFPDTVRALSSQTAISDASKAIVGDDPTKREYVVQYEETDLDFLSRWLEHEGIYYFFEQDILREKLIVCNNKSRHNLLQTHPTRTNKAPCFEQPAQGQVQALDWFHEEVVVDIVQEQHSVPSSIIVRDYHWKSPTDTLEKTASIGGARGEVYQTANHYRIPEEGESYAAIRAQELACRTALYRGEGNCRLFRPGFKTDLTGHRRTAFNSVVLLLTQVSHHARQEVDFSSGVRGAASYFNSFSGIPETTQYRPPRITDWPRIPGVIKATVDTQVVEGRFNYARLDSDGNYRVRLGLDRSNAAEGAASAPVRMAQPYSGASYGIHFPLHKDVEVMLAHVNGDPDRPIIAGAVPNTANKTPVANDNFTRCQIKTAGGNLIELQDLEQDQIITLCSGSYMPGFADGTTTPNEFIAPSYLLLGQTGSEITTRVDYSAHNTSSLAYLTHDVLAGQDIAWQCMREFKATVGFRPLVQLRVILQAAWVRANRAISESKTKDNTVIMPAMVYAPLLNAVVSVIIAKIGAKILATITAKVSNPRDLPAQMPQQQVSRLRKAGRAVGSALKEAFMSVLEPLTDMLDALNPLVMDSKIPPVVSTVTLRKKKPFFSVTRVSGPTVPGSMLSLNNTGENFQFFTESGSFDLHAGEDVAIDAARSLMLEAEEDLHASTLGGRLHLTDTEAQLVSGDRKARMQILSAAPSGGPIKSAGDAESVHLGFCYDRQPGAPSPEKWNEVKLDPDGVHINGKDVNVIAGETCAMQALTDKGVHITADPGKGSSAIKLKRGATEITIDSSGVTIKTAAGQKLGINLGGDLDVNAGGKNVSFNGVGTFTVAATGIDLGSSGQFKLAAPGQVDVNGAQFQPVVPPPPAPPLPPDPPPEPPPPPPILLPVPPGLTQEELAAAERARKANFQMLLDYFVALGR